jgi:hypothetical protein
MDKFSYACVRDSDFSYQTEVEIQFFIYLSMLTLVSNYKASNVKMVGK